jgi:hypothetical protein
MSRFYRWFLFFLMAGYASASTVGIPTCSADTLFAYQVAPAAPCAQGIIEYSAFSLTSFSVPDGSLDRLQVARQILVTPNGAGFDFSSPLFNVGAGQTATFDIVYSDLVDPAPIEVGATLELDPPFGDITVTQTYSTPPCETASVSLTVDTLHPVATVMFPCALTQGTVETDITLVGPAAFDRVGSQLLLTSIPELSSLWLVGIGLAFVTAGRKIFLRMYVDQ